MQITLNQNEIEEALIKFVEHQGINITGKADVTLIAGRAPNGMSATINISNDGQPKQDVVIPRTIAVEVSSTVVEATEEIPADETITEDTVAHKPLFGA